MLLLDPYGRPQQLAYPNKPTVEICTKQKAFVTKQTGLPVLKALTILPIKYYK